MNEVILGHNSDIFDGCSHYRYGKSIECVNISCLSAICLYYTCLLQEMPRVYRLQQARRPRVFRERKNGLQMYTDEELLSRYRMDRDTITMLDDLIRDQITPPTARNRSLNSVKKLLITLRYLATGKMQLCEADSMGVSQSTVSRVVNEVLVVLSSPAVIQRFITFPLTDAQLNHNKQACYHIANFPGVIGLIDCTHIKIIAPHVNEPDYVNRHHKHSINTQLVFDCDDCIIDVVASWPGSTHDSRILTQSGLFQMFERGVVPRGNHYMLGDSGYPCKRWLLTPYLHPVADSQQSYNR